MKKIVKSLLRSVCVLFFFNCINAAFAESYSLNVYCPYGKYYGDYSGIMHSSGTVKIGPYAKPFTLTLVPLSEYLTTETCSSWGVETYRYQIGEA